MAKGISSGVERAAHAQAASAAAGKPEEQMSKQWKELRNRLDTLLMANNVMKGNELRQQCLAMDSMTTDERKTHILTHWGPLYLTRVEPILQQLETLERIISEHSKKKE